MKLILLYNAGSSLDSNDFSRCLPAQTNRSASILSSGEFSFFRFEGAGLAANSRRTVNAGITAGKSISRKWDRLEAGPISLIFLTTWLYTLYHSK
ncbi:hypothetical protein D3C71_1560130 [compost metagenome]